jgi:hypothetical protein
MDNEGWIGVRARAPVWRLINYPSMKDYPGMKVGQAFQPDKQEKSGWKA